MSRRFKRLVCRWYGHDWALGAPCERACLTDICFRCGTTETRHSKLPAFCLHLSPARRALINRLLERTHT